MRELTDSEVDGVHGGWGPLGAGFGALVAAAGYLGNAATSGNFSYRGFAITAAGGAVTGAVGGPVTGAARRYLLPRISGGFGAWHGLERGPRG